MGIAQGSAEELADPPFITTRFTYNEAILLFTWSTL